MISALNILFFKICIVKKQYHSSYNKARNAIKAVPIKGADIKYPLVFVKKSMTQNEYDVISTNNNTRKINFGDYGNHF